MKTIEIQNSSLIFLTPGVQVLELRLPAVSAEFHLREKIGFLRLSPLSRTNAPAHKKSTRFSAFLRQLRAAFLKLHLPLLRTRTVPASARTVILHQPQQTSAGASARIPRIYLN
jgi:hypothetical protein